MATVNRLFRHQHYHFGGLIAYTTSNSLTCTRQETSSQLCRRRTASSRGPSIDDNQANISGTNILPRIHEVDLEYVRKHYEVRRRGQEGYGTREYLLVPPDVNINDLNALSSRTGQERQDDDSTPPPPVAAALLAHRNILFGARAFFGYDIEQVCQLLVQIALQDAGEKGEQPQAMAALNGLSSWVETCLTNDEYDSSRTKEDTAANATSNVLVQLKQTDMVAWEAVRAIATGIPRPGHSVVGAGTFRDGEAAWKALAREYVELGLAPEANLYQKEGGRLVAIEHLADRNPDYLDSAGGAMARLFFL